mgnify:CR=1 FL=1
MKTVIKFIVLAVIAFALGASLAWFQNRQNMPAGETPALGHQLLETRIGIDLPVNIFIVHWNLSPRSLPPGGSRGGYFRLGSDEHHPTLV